MGKSKLHQLLAVEPAHRDTAKRIFHESQNNFTKGKMFTGSVVKTTHTLEGSHDETKESHVVTSIPDRWNYTLSQIKDSWNTELSKEAGNASGKAKATLTLEGQDFGEVSAIECLSLKSKLSQLLTLAGMIPVRDSGTVWKVDDNHCPEATKGTVFVSPVEVKNRQGARKVARKIEGYPDDPKSPHATHEEQYLLGTLETTMFSGELSASQKHQLIEKLTRMKAAVEDCRARANEIEVDNTDLGTKVLDLLKI